MKYYKFVGSYLDACGYKESNPIVDHIYRDVDVIGDENVEFWAEDSCKSINEEWEEVSEQEYETQKLIEEIATLRGETFEEVNTRAKRAVSDYAQKYCVGGDKITSGEFNGIKLSEGTLEEINNLAKSTGNTASDITRNVFDSIVVSKEVQDSVDEYFNKVNSPPHYNQGKVECIDAIESATIGKDGFEGALVANVIKYLWRYESKGDKLTDINKALWYLNKLRDHVESND